MRPWLDVVDELRLQMKERKIRKLSVRRVGSTYQLHVSAERGVDLRDMGATFSEVDAPVEG